MLPFPNVREKLASALMLLAMAPTAAAQERPAPAVDVEFAWYGFPDDGIVSEIGLGGDLRWYVSPRVSIGPELIYIAGSNHSHFVATGNLTWDIRSPKNGVAASTTPYLVIGGGMFQTRETFFRGPYTHTEGAFTAGGGVRSAVNQRVTIGVDARMGWEAHVRINGVVGVRLGR